MLNKILKLEKNDFPEKLKNINNPPQKLYYIGNIELIYENCFGIVGTRNITQYGIKNCEFFTKEIVLRKIPTVSGLAIGTDTIVHKISIDYGGKTIAVLGSGLEEIYPKENIELFQRIIDNGGLILSEYENKVVANKNTFPLRNRIVSAISDGILVIEAAYRSGTSITIKYAKEQGKKVFALPGRLDSCVGVGVNKMIKKGAILVTDINDILTNYPQFANKKRKTIVKKLNIKKEYIEIYKILQKKEVSMEDLLTETQYSYKEIIKILSNMEIEKIIVNDMGIYKLRSINE